MHAVLALLAQEPLVYLFLVVALGALLGKVSVGGIRLHAAAVLFVAIALTALGVSQGVALEVDKLIGDLGLALFAFAIGVTSGPSFFHAVRTAWPRILVSALVLVVAGGVTAAGGRLLGLAPDTTAGTFAGALTNTPSLAAATPPRWSNWRRRRSDARGWPPAAPRPWSPHRVRLGRLSHPARRFGAYGNGFLVLHG